MHDTIVIYICSRVNLSIYLTSQQIDQQTDSRVNMQVRISIGHKITLTRTQTHTHSYIGEEGQKEGVSGNNHRSRKDTWHWETDLYSAPNPPVCVCVCVKINKKNEAARIMNSQMCQRANLVWSIVQRVSLEDREFQMGSFQNYPVLFKINSSSLPLLLKQNNLSCKRF